MTWNADRRERQLLAVQADFDRLAQELIREEHPTALESGIRPFLDRSAIEASIRLRFRSLCERALALGAESPEVSPGELLSEQCGRWVTACVVASVRAQDENGP